MCISILQGDITTRRVDVIVNAAKSSLLGGGGVDGAIHEAAGPALLAACRLVGGCPTGEARLTPGFSLPSRYVIHTVGPQWSGGTSDEPALLASCYRQSLELARAYNCRSIAFPAISCGVYGYPIELAAPIAISTVRDVLHEFASTSDYRMDGVELVCFSPDDTAVYQRALDAVE